MTSFVGLGWVSFSFPQNLDVLLKPIPQAIGMAQTIMTIRLILLAGVAPKYSHAKQSLRATKIIDLGKGSID